MHTDRQRQTGTFARTTSTRCDADKSHSYIHTYILARTPASTSWTATWSTVIGGNGAYYGYSVSLSGSTMAVGSPSDNVEFLNDQGLPRT